MGSNLFTNKKDSIGLRGEPFQAFVSSWKRVAYLLCLTTIFEGSIPLWKGVADVMPQLRMTLNNYLSGMIPEVDIEH